MTASQDHGSAIWEAESGKKIAEVLQPPVGEYAAFSPDGKDFAAGIDRWTVGLWNSEDGTAIRKITTAASWPYDVTFSAIANDCLRAPGELFQMDIPHICLILKMER